MSKPTVKGKAQALLALVEQLAQMPGLTWVDANNAVYAPGGPFSRLFPSKADRVAFGKTKESEQIDGLITSLPEPPVRPWPSGEEHNGVMIPVGKSAARPSRERVGQPHSLARQSPPLAMSQMQTPRDEFLAEAER